MTPNFTQRKIAAKGHPVDLEKRNTTLYVYVKRSNLRWLKMAAAKNGTSTSHVTDEVITFARKMFGDAAVKPKQRRKKNVSHKTKPKRRTH